MCGVGVGLRALITQAGKERLERLVSDLFVVLDSQVDDAALLAA